MNTLTLALDLLIIQAVLGAVDTIYHHELRAALPQQRSADLELRIHSIRSLLYGVAFLGLAWVQWGGVWVVALGTILLVEVVLTLWDFLVEDRSRLLPKSERVLHTVLALNAGVIFAFLGMHAPLWWGLPSTLTLTYHGWQSIVLSAFALGVVLSGLRDGFASRALGRFAERRYGINFGRSAQHVLMTGGTGFIGQELCRALLAEGHTLTLLVRDPLKAAYLFEGRVRCITRLADLSPATRVDVAINLAGEPIVGPRWTKARRRKLMASRVDTTQALIEWIDRAAFKPRLMLSASAVGFYGVQDLDDPVALTEAATPQPLFVSELCQRWESAAGQVVRCGVPLAVLRFGLVFGHQGVLPMMLLPFKLGLGGRIGSGKQVMSWVHIADVLGVVAHLMRSANPKEIQGVYNVTAPQAVPQEEFAHTAATVLHRPCLVPTPAFLFRLLLGSQATLLLDGQRVRPGRLEQAGFRFRFPRLEGALRDLVDNETQRPPSLYQRSLGSAYDALAPVLKRLHAEGERRLYGTLSVRRGSRAIVRALLWLARLPRPQQLVPCDVLLQPHRKGERWKRWIGGREMVSTQEPGRPAVIIERFGPLGIHLATRVRRGSLWQRSCATTFLGVRLPAILGMQVVARETPVDGDSFYCDMRLRSPLFGSMLQYSGTLRLATK